MTTDFEFLSFNKYVDSAVGVASIVFLQIFVLFGTALTLNPRIFGLSFNLFHNNTTCFVIESNRFFVKFAGFVTFLLVN